LAHGESPDCMGIPEDPEPRQSASIGTAGRNPLSGPGRREPTVCSCTAMRRTASTTLPRSAISARCTPDGRPLTLHWLDIGPSGHFRHADAAPDSAPYTMSPGFEIDDSLLPEDGRSVRFVTRTVSPIDLERPGRRAKESDSMASDAPGAVLRLREVADVLPSPNVALW
jgi:hypothetical protein